MVMNWKIEICINHTISRRGEGKRKRSKRQVKVDWLRAIETEKRAHLTVLRRYVDIGIVQI